MEVCRLCLDLVATQGDAKPLDGETRDMVQVVAPELNLEASKNPSVCSECQKTLSRLFDFKSRVFEHEGEIREKVGDRRGTVSLKAAVTGEADPPLDPDRDKAKDRLCRTCLAPIECESFTVLRPSEPDAYLSSMLDMCLVEVDLALTKDPVMCEGCLDNLQKLHHFKSSCQDVEDKIVDYCNKNKLKESTVVDLHAVLESERPRDIEMLTVKDEDGASGSKIKDEEKEVEPKSEDEDEEMSEDEEEDEEMSEDEEVKQEELDIKSETEPGTSDSDKQTHFNKRNDSNELMVCPFKFPFTTTEKGLFKNHLYDIHNCPAMFGTDWQLKEHYVENHKLRIQCLFCPYQALTKHYMNRHRCKNNSFPYKCPSCPFKTATKCAIVQHNRDIHKQQVAFRCKVCPEQHQYTCNLRAHMFDVIPGKRKYIYKCPSCPLTEATERALMKHNRVVHNQQVVFRCKVCIKWRRDTCYPTGHPFVILIEKYECPSCRLKTATKAEIVKHNRFKHRQQVVFKCKECPAEHKYTCNSEEHFMDVLPIDQKYELSTLTAGQQQVIFYLIDNNKKK